MSMNYGLMGTLLRRLPYYKQWDKQTRKIMIVDELSLFQIEILRDFGSWYNYQRYWCKKNGFVTPTLYKNDLAKRNGFKSWSSYVLHTIYKRFKKKIDYENYLANKRGFRTQNDYLNYRYQLKGFKDRAEFQRFKRKQNKLLQDTRGNFTPNGVVELPLNSIKTGV